MQGDLHPHEVVIYVLTDSSVNRRLHQDFEKKEGGRCHPKQPIVVPAKNSTNSFMILEGEPSETLGEGNPKK